METQNEIQLDMEPQLPFVNRFPTGFAAAAAARGAGVSKFVITRKKAIPCLSRMYKHWETPDISGQCANVPLFGNRTMGVEFQSDPGRELQPSKLKDALHAHDEDALLRPVYGCNKPVPWPRSFFPHFPCCFNCLAQRAGRDRNETDRTHVCGTVDLQSLTSSLSNPLEPGILTAVLFIGYGDPCGPPKLILGNDQ